MAQASIGPYRVISALGAGGMGEVFLAVDTRLDRKVALKYLSDPSLDTPRERERLLREARAAAQITHPNIAAIYDILETGDHPCIVMEYAQGETLAALAARGPLPCDQVVRVGIQLADALQHAHAAGVIHRDLKPLNIVLTPEGAPKVLDFGVARQYATGREHDAADASTCAPSSGQLSGMAGTPMYMAPEQLAGHPASTLSDIYSLGATLFELLTGRRPFEGSSPADIVYQVLSRPTPLVSAYNGAVPPLLTAVVAKAMAKDRVDRYLSAEQMAEDLRRAQAECATDPSGRHSRSSVTGSVVEAVAAASRRRGVMALAGAVVVGALLVTGWYAIRGPSAPAAEASQFIAVLQFTNDTGDGTADAEVAGISEALMATMEGLSAVTVLGGPEASRFLRAGGDIRKAVAGTGVTRLITGSVSGPAAARQMTVAVEQIDRQATRKHVYRVAPGELTATLGTAVRDVVADLGVVTTPADASRLRGAPACRAETYALVARGRVLLERPDVPGQAARAEAAFRQAVDRDESCAVAQAGLADASWARFQDTSDPKLFAQATRAVERARALDADSPSVYRALATHYLNQGKAEHAEGPIREVIKRRRGDDEPHRLYSSILDALDRTEESVAELNVALALRPANMINYVALGMRQQDRGEFTQAVASYEHVLAVQPDNEWARINLIAALVQAGAFDRAIAEFEGKPVKDRNPTVLGNAGTAYLALRKCDAAARLLLEAVGLDQRSDIKHRNLGDAYTCLGRPSAARMEYLAASELLDQFLKVNRKSASALARSAVCDAKLGRMPQALMHITDALALKPDDNNVLFKSAVVHALAGRSTEAVEYLRKALDAGYSRPFAAIDSDLDSIRRVPEVQRMLNGTKNH